MANIYRNPHMQEAIKRSIRAAMVKNGETYDSLCRTLAEEYGIQHNPQTLKSKVNKGTVGAQLFIYVLLALGFKSIDLDELEKLALKCRGQ